MKFTPVGGRGNEYLCRPEGKTAIWVDRYKKGFGRKQETLRTDIIVEARKRRDELFATWLSETSQDAILKKGKTKLVCNDLWHEWVKTKDRKSKGTRDNIKYCEGHLLPVIGPMFPEKLTEIWWENTYIPEKRAKSPDRKFFNDWKWLNSFLRYLHRQGKLAAVPKLENPDGDPEEGLNLEDCEIHALYLEAGIDLEIKLDLGFMHFMRRSEVNLLPWAEIDFKEGVITLGKTRTKIRKSRQVPLRVGTLQKLKARYAKSNSPYVFPSPSDPSKSINRDGHRTSWDNAISRANIQAQKAFEMSGQGCNEFEISQNLGVPIWIVPVWIERKGNAIRHEATFHDTRHSGLSRAAVQTTKYAQLCVMAGVSFKVLQKVYLHLKPDDTRFLADLVRYEQADEKVKTPEIEVTIPTMKNEGMITYDRK